MKRWKIFLIALAALGAVGAAGWYGFQTSRAEANTPAVVEPSTVTVELGDVEQTVTAPGQLVGTREASLEMGVGGRLTEIAVQPGDRVSAGDLLARIGDLEKFEAAVAQASREAAEAQAELGELILKAPEVTAQAQMDLVAAQQAYEKAQNERAKLDYRKPDAQTLESAKAQYLLAEKEFTRAETEYNALSGRSEDDPERMFALSAYLEARKRRDQAQATYNYYLGKPSDLEVTEADANLALAEAKLEIAQARWEQVKDGVDPAAQKLAEAKLEDANRKLAQAQADLEHLELRAPFAGVVLEVKAQVGSTVTAEAPVIVLSDPAQVEVQATVVEEDMPLVYPGEKASLFFDARPEAEATGQVERVVPQRTSGDRPVYPVYLSVDELPEGLVPGMTVDASIVIDSRQGVLVLPRAVVRARGDGTATVQVWVDGHKEAREVKVGLRGDQTVEILEGLQEGERVVAQ